MGTTVLPEHCLTAADVAKRCGVALSTVYVWISRGVRVKGVRARLAAVRVGWGWRVGEDGLAAFLAALNGGERVELAEQRTRRQRQAEAAADEGRRMLGLPPRAR
jgi:predicted transcriptional regulator